MNMNMDMSHIVIIVLLVVILYFVLRLNYPMNKEGFSKCHGLTKEQSCKKCSSDSSFLNTHKALCDTC